MTSKPGDVFGIAGKVALVTGGNRNIGRSIALAFAGAGVAPMILLHEDETVARQVRGEVGALGVRSRIFQADLTDVGRLKEIVAEVEHEFGGVDILVNNAAIRPNPKISEITVEEWDRVFATNLRAPFFLSQAVLPDMVRRGWGRIVSIGEAGNPRSTP